MTAAVPRNDQGHVLSLVYYQEMGALRRWGLGDAVGGRGKKLIDFCRPQDALMILRTAW